MRVRRRYPENRFTQRRQDLIGGRHQNADNPARAAFVLKFHHAGDFGKKRVVLADAYVFPGLEPGATLPDKDRAARDHLPVKALYAKPLRIGIPAISCTS